MTLGYFFWLVLANAIGFGIGAGVLLFIDKSSEAWRNRKRK